MPALCARAREEWRTLWRERCPEGDHCLRAALPDGAAADEFVLLPLHPLNEAKVRELYARDPARPRGVCRAPIRAAVAPSSSVVAIAAAAVFVVVVVSVFRRRRHRRRRDLS